MMTSLVLKRKLYNYNVHEYNKEMQKRKIFIISLFMNTVEENLYEIDKKWYVRPLLQERVVHSHFNTMINEHRLSNSDLFFNFTRMSPTTFEELVILMGPSLQRIHSRPDILSVGEILAATLRYLAAGESMTDIMFNFRIGKSTVSKIIVECCNCLWDVLYKDVLFTPTEEGWKKLSKEFFDKWQMPNCVGALDGKHVVHQAFPNSGSINYNYKGTHGTILLALCDANYNFTCVDIGMPGRCSDGGVLRASEMGRRILQNNFNFPEASPISENFKDCPYFIVADEAFPLLPNVMRPYPGRGNKNLPLKSTIFNYRLSRARRCIENCFGILVSRWRIYRRVIIASEPTVMSIIKATVVLHNLIKKKETESGLYTYYSPTCFGETEKIANQNAAGLVPVGQMGTNFYDRNSKEIRSKLTDYFATEGSVPFQYDNI